MPQSPAQISALLFARLYQTLLENTGRRRDQETPVRLQGESINTVKVNRESQVIGIVGRSVGRLWRVRH